MPARVVLDHPDAVAFLDRSPVFKGHVLVVPRSHVVTLADLPAVDIGPFFLQVQRLVAILPKAIGCDGTFVARDAPSTLGDYRCARWVSMCLNKWIREGRG